jgi:hypothetical protein
MNLILPRLSIAVFLVSAFSAVRAWSAENITITGVPDYGWYAGCFGTASGNLMGYWDRSGFPDFYTGPTGDSLAPLNTAGSNSGIRSMWASMAGFDGRPPDKPGHIDDYWTYFYNDDSYSYESTLPDPYLVAGRPEHEPDCIGDFIGASQNKWSDLAGECAGNIDAYAFNFWDKQGALRINFTPPPLNGIPVRDVQSGLRSWAQYRGYEASVSSQLVDVNPNIPPGTGFSFEDLKAEILRGYPVLLMLQNPNEFSRNLGGMRGNPNIHAMLAYHVVIMDDGTQLVQYRTSWATGEASGSWAQWGSQPWAVGLPLRGVILFHPLPKLRQIERANGKLTIRWDGPNSTLWDDVNQTEVAAHSYTLESAPSLDGKFAPLGDPTPNLNITVADPGADHVFFRLKLSHPAYDGISGF